MGDEVVFDTEPHDAADRDVAVVHTCVQRVRDDHPVAVGEDVFDLVAQPGIDARKPGTRLAYSSRPVQPLPSAAVCSLTKSSLTWDDDGGGITGGEGREVRGAALGGVHPATEPQTSCAFSYTPWS